MATFFVFVGDRALTNDIIDVPLIFPAMTPYYQNSMATLYKGDCLAVMPQLEGKFDAIICDLPYSLTACKWDNLIPFEPLWENYKRLIKPKGAIVLFGSQPFTSRLVASNYEWFRYEWIWSKSNGGGFLNANRHPLKRHENIVIFSRELCLYNPIKTKGKPYACTRASAGVTTFDQSVAGWITVNNGERYPTSIIEIPNDTGLHPTQKPIALLDYLIRTYTNEGDLILDNTCGSGTTLVAAQLAGRRSVGIEREEEYCEVTVKRLQEITAQQDVKTNQSKQEAIQPTLFTIGGN